MPCWPRVDGLVSTTRIEERQEQDMDVAAPMATGTAQDRYVRDNLAGARHWLAQAHGLLAQRPAIVAPREHIERAIDAARTAAEHLYDVGQVDDPVEAVREALAAAEAIMVVVNRLEFPRPAAVDVREVAAQQLREVDRTIAGLEQALAIPLERRHAFALAT
jgi:hypothetical protein